MIRLLIATICFIIPVLSSAKEGKCEYVFSEAPAAILERLIGKPELRRELIYPIGVNKTADRHVMFGFESEYTLETSQPLLRIYMPRKEFGISEKQWLAKTDAERSLWVQHQFSRQATFSKDAGLELIRPIRGMEYLPRQLIKDDSGSLEIVLDPVNELSTFVHQVNSISERFGSGSMQAMISAPKESFFYSKKGNSAAEKIGFFTLLAEVDALQKLRKGADRFEIDPTKQVARSFIHPFLAPLTAHRQDWLKRYLTANAQGKLFDKESLKKVVYSEDSFKYVGTSAYRPDIGGSKRVSVEIRDAHIDKDQLIEKTSRMVAAYTRGTERFAPFAETKSLQTDIVFAQLPLSVQEGLRQIFPTRIQVSEDFNANEVFSQEVFRNFAYPMRDWSPFLKIMKKERYLSEVRSSQKDYLHKITSLTKDFAAGIISQEQASARIQGALAIFSKDSGLHEHFENYIYAQL